MSVIPEKGSRAGLRRWVLHSLECSSSWVMKQPAPVQFLLLCCLCLWWYFTEMVIYGDNLPELHNINQSAAPVQAAGLTRVPQLGFGSIYPPCEMPGNDSPCCLNSAGQDAGAVLLGTQCLRGGGTALSWLLWMTLIMWVMPWDVMGGWWAPGGNSFPNEIPISLSSCCERRRRSAQRCVGSCSKGVTCYLSEQRNWGYITCHWELFSVRLSLCFLLCSREAACFLVIRKKISKILQGGRKC